MAVELQALEERELPPLVEIPQVGPAAAVTQVE